MPANEFRLQMHFRITHHLLFVANNDYILTPLAPRMSLCLMNRRDRMVNAVCMKALACQSPYTTQINL